MTDSLKEAAKTGNHQKTLIALRDKLAGAIDDCNSGRDLAALSRRLIDVMEKIPSTPDPDVPKTPLQRAREQRKEDASARRDLARCQAHPSDR